MSLFNSLLQTWFEWSLHGGYPALFLLMAMESSIMPIPSELIIPPAAFWASQGKMDFWLVILVATAGSWVGSATTYTVARLIGRPVILKYGRYFFLSEGNLQAAEAWLNRYASLGIFSARMLPVLRHLISIPAGMIRMPFRKFSFMTILGALLWCTILTGLSQKILGSRPDLLQNPDALLAACQAKAHLLIPAVLLFTAAYLVVKRWSSIRRSS